jgi:hypothetical protein
MSRDQLEALRDGIASMVTDLEESKKIDALKATSDHDATEDGEYAAPVVEAEDLVPDEPITDEVDEEDKEHISQIREVMKALTNIPRGLPSSLWNWSISDLAKAVVDGTKRTAPDGTPLVEINNSWYIVDASNAGTYMNEWKDEEPTVKGRTKEEREEMLVKLEDRLVEGKISEETYERLRKKYEDD